MDTPSPLYELLDAAIPGGLAAYVADKRKAGRSWRGIEYDIHADHGREITAQTLRNWFPELVKAAS